MTIRGARLELEVPAVLAGERLDRVLALLAGRPRAEIARQISSGEVVVGGVEVHDRDRRVAAHERIELAGHPEWAGLSPVLVAPEAMVDLDIVYEDQDVIVVDKPAGVVVHPGAGHRTGTLVSGLLARFPDLAAASGPRADDQLRPGIVHRLDKDTSGLMVVARTRGAREHLVEQLASRSVTRVYLCAVAGSVAADEGLVDAPLGRSVREPTRIAVRSGGRPARTRYRVEERYRAPLQATLLRVWLETGRTHQIRVHLAAIGHQVLGDRRYAKGAAPLGLERQFLHATELTFVHPASGEAMTFASRLPVDLERARAQLALVTPRDAAR